jgi:1-phosphofructokinase family hexose kinase
MIGDICNRLNKSIVTVTMNPVLDRTLKVKNFRAGGTFQVDRSESFAGGKGVNVSRALRAFGIDSTATGMLADGGSDVYKNLLDTGEIAHDFLSISGFLRTNVTIVSDSSGKETHLREKGPVISRSMLRGFEEKIRPLYKEDVIFVISGSLPDGLHDKTYSFIINEARSAGADAFFDASGPSFKEGIKAAPLFIKPNAREVEEALGFYPELRDDFLKSVRAFHSMGIKNVMITLGKNGLIYSRGEEIVHAQAAVPAPVNTVGSGDAALAGGIIGVINGFDTADTARIACALGSANTQISGACVFEIKEVEKYCVKTKISVLG